MTRQEQILALHLLEQKLTEVGELTRAILQSMRVAKEFSRAQVEALTP